MNIFNVQFQCRGSEVEDNKLKNVLSRKRGNFLGNEFLFSMFLSFNWDAQCLQANNEERWGNEI